MLAEIQQFIQSVRRHNPEANTWRNYHCDLRLFISVVGDCPPGQVTSGDIDRFVSAQVERGLKPTTLNRRLAAIVSLYKFLGLSCPVRPRRHRLKEPQHLARPLSADEWQRFLAVIHAPRDRAMFLLMRFGGLRRAEVAHLKMADLQPPRLVVRGKGARERTAYLIPEAVQALQDWLDERPKAESEFVFLSYQNKRMSTTAIHKRLMVYRQLSGVNLTAHCLRHSFATTLLSAGAPVTSIQKLLGHRRLKTTQHYVLIDNQCVRQDYLSACSRLEGWAGEKGAHLPQWKTYCLWTVSQSPKVPARPSHLM